jgi:translation initiation factor IF-2
MGVECGIDLAGFKDIKVGDVIEAFTNEKMADELGKNTAVQKKEKEVREAREQQEAVVAKEAADAKEAAEAKVTA